MSSFFGKIAADTLGISDIGKIISPKDFDKVDGDDYIFHEDNEKIFFVIKSKSDEYVFTNYAVIHVDGANATSKKRVVNRYEFLNHQVNNVYIETAGHIDLDIEIKFNLNQMHFSIDVDKNQLEQLKDLYKTLFEIGRIQSSNSVYFDNKKESLKIAESMLLKSVCEFSDTNSFITLYKDITNFNLEWLNDATDNFKIRDFSDIYTKYIQN